MKNAIFALLLCACASFAQVTAVFTDKTDIYFARRLVGERLAEEHLLQQGAQLLERNYRIDYGEIDLLMEHEGDLVAIEVKTRDVLDLEQPEEAVRWSQLRRIVRAMTTYAMDEDLLVA